MIALNKKNNIWNVTMSKAQYKIRNWSAYNRSLINRGNITLWVAPEVDQSWYSTKQTQKKGHPEVYSNSCIELILTIRSLYRLSWVIN